MPGKPTAILYAGPSLTPATIQAIDLNHQLELRPPVERGHLPQLLDTGFAGTLIIADGIFHTRLAVGHIEIRDALQAGCRVYGLASMGAIRAYEMRHLGMQGYGKVYQQFSAYPDFQDDEVALLHEHAPPYKPISEPLVHLRECLKCLINESMIEAVQARHIIEYMKERWFGDRTLKLFLKLLAQHTDADADKVRQSFDQYRIKALDLAQFIEEQIWQKGAVDG